MASFQNALPENNNGNEYMTPPDNMTTQVNVSWPERVASASIGTFLLMNGLSNIISKHPISALVRTAIGGFLLYRGASGNCPLYSSLGKQAENVEQAQAIEITTSVTVNKPKAEVYNFWRRLENLPRFMSHLQEVIELDQKRSHWEAKIPGKIATVKWNAEITNEEQDRMIAWRSIPGSMVENAGRVEFNEAGNGTTLNVTITYRPPAGQLGAGIAKLINPAMEKMVQNDIMNFKHYIETQEIASQENQPVGSMNR
jgi:uncharacterized membrane protein